MTPALAALMARPDPAFLAGKKVVIFDSETSGLLEADEEKGIRKATIFHCMQIGDANGDDSVLYGDHPLCDEPLEAGHRRLEAADYIVGQNVIGYDYFIMRRFFGDRAPPLSKYLDTLVMGRMSDPKERNHTLQRWGFKLGIPKDEYKGDYQIFDEDFARYSRNDIHAGRGMFHATKHVLDWRSRYGDKLHAYKIEHDVQYCVSLMEQGGIHIDVRAAEELYAGLLEEQGALKAKLLEMFPPFNRSSSRVAKVGNRSKGITKGQVVVKSWSEEFSPGSRQKIAEALLREGWVPKEFNAPSKRFPEGTPKVDEDTLAGIPGEGPELVRKYLRTTKLMSQLMGATKSARGLLQLVKADSRVYGRCKPIGAVTWRAAHSGPNLGNVDKDPRVRALYKSTPGWFMGGTDGAEIQARFLAHYLYIFDKGLYRDKLLKGDKKAGTDGHSLNRASLAPYGLATRDGAKTALYARIFGCRAPRMFETINEDRRKNGLVVLPQKITPTEMAKRPDIVEAIPAVLDRLRREARQGKRSLDLQWAVGQGAIDALGLSMPGLNDLLELVQRVGKAKGYLEGVGGGQVPVSALHSALVSLLQNGEATAMKLAANILMFEEGPKRGWVYGRDYRLLLWVHDEWDYEAPTRELVQEVGDVLAEAIAEAGRRLGLNVPLAGETKTGLDWHDVH